VRAKYNPPYFVKKLFSDFIWETSNDKILLTFDDGPTEVATPKILSILKEKKIKAIFFCVGDNIKKHPELAAKILKEGHTIGNHTMNHKLLTRMSREESIEELVSFNKLINDRFNNIVKYFRPTHGRFNLKTNNILKERSMKCVMWSLLTYDFENSFEKVKYAIDNYLQNNSLIVFHDNVKCSEIIEKSLSYTIDRVYKKGFEFGEPEDCLK
jgi:peptidoglycan/xylan/chitin deacetylase (PgdA/CDA1 family)